MAHTKEEARWEAEQQRRKEVLAHYRSKRIVREVMRALGVKNPYKVDPWAEKNLVIRNMLSMSGGLASKISTSKSNLGLIREEGEAPSAYEGSILNAAFARGKRVRRKIMSVEESRQAFENARVSDVVDFCKYHDELVRNKGIDIVSGSCTFLVYGKEKKISGTMRVLNAREVRASWLKEANLRAFRVAVIPERADGLGSANIGYAAISTAAPEVMPSFGVDIDKAVSLMKRRVKAEFMRQMGI
jgi:hypothetical protein